MLFPLSHQHLSSIGDFHFSAVNALSMEGGPPFIRAVPRHWLLCSSWADVHLINDHAHRLHSSYSSFCLEDLPFPITITITISITDLPSPKWFWLMDCTVIVLEVQADLSRRGDVGLIDSR